MFNQQPLSLISKSLCLKALLVVTCFGGANFALAELKLLDDESMSALSAQGGLTIDIETKVSIAEFEYVDAGSWFYRDIELSGIGGGLLDNIRAIVDASDGTETLSTGFSEYARLGAAGYLDATEADVAWAINEYSDGSGGFGKQYDDGDLLIHVTSTDMGGVNVFQPPVAAEQAQNLQSMKDAVDLQIKQREFGLRSSDGLVETVLSRNFSVEAYLGYIDILLKNNGNGFTQSDGSGGKPDNVILRDSYMALDVKFRVEDLDIDSTNNATNTFVPRAVTTPYLTLRDMRIHNERGLDTEGSFGFASVQSKMAAAEGILNLNDPGHGYFVDGQAIYDINVQWDWDLPHVSLGDTGQSIGEVYFTDFHIVDTSLVISAH